MHDDVDLVEEISLRLRTTEPITLVFIAEVLKDVVLFDQKQHDYGSENIAAFGEPGVLVRANDKMARLRHLIRIASPKAESIDDSWQDLSIYGVIARMVRNGVWK